MTGFEPATTRPQTSTLNRTELHPFFFIGVQITNFVRKIANANPSFFRQTISEEDHVVRFG